MQTGKPVFDASKLTAGAWAHAIAAAEKWNQPGVFTTLHGFEWTSAPGGNNLHRTVIFRDNADRVSRSFRFPPSTARTRRTSGSTWTPTRPRRAVQVLAIPHNGNLSNGVMYTAETFDGKPMTRDYAEARASHEPLLEATQIKGDGETHPFLSPNDEFANFERWDVNFSKMAPAENGVLHGNYVRSALKLGLELDAKLGANPYQAGLIGGSDAHVGVITTREDNFFGEFANGLPSPDRWKTPLAMIDNDPKKGPLVSVWQEQAAGLGGVWARENTREAIWDALKRREVYATTGDRPVVRVFAGWDFAPADNDRPDFAANGYAHGVPMGGDLVRHRRASDQSSWFTRCAIRKGRTSTASRSSRAGSATTARRKSASSTSRSPAGARSARMVAADSVGNTVDVANASYTNTIGATTLSAYWKDPTFDASERAFYYVRVIQIPSPRWTAYDQKRFGIKMAHEVPMTVTDRAYTSPIWYTPAR